MTFSVSRDNGRFEWAGDNLLSVFCQPSRLLDPGMWRMLYDVLRFNACARALLSSDKKHDNPDELSIGKYLEREGYSDSFRDNYLIVCAIGFHAFVLRTIFVAHDSGHLEHPTRQVRFGFSRSHACTSILIRNLRRCSRNSMQVQFFSNHHLLQITGKPNWLTINGGRLLASLLIRIFPRSNSFRAASCMWIP
jgi:predicted NAD/FAD-binding protein